MSTLAVTGNLISMDMENARVTRREAAALAGVSERTINRWSAEELITVQRNGWRLPATYDPAEVLRAAGRNRNLAKLADADTPGSSG